jgi:hypothetical protein
MARASLTFSPLSRLLANVRQPASISFVVEGFVDERREHRSVSGFMALWFALATRVHSQEMDAILVRSDEGDVLLGAL